jgi:TRAP-type C4-dicarboxylate transport system substrate-binding protein
MKTLAKYALIAAAMTLAVAGGAGAQNVDGPSVFWKWSTWGKPRAFTAGVEKLSERVSEETGGKFKIQIFYGGQLAKSRENLDGLKNNAFEGAMFCNFYSPGKNPAFMVYSMPFVPLGDFRVSAHVRNNLMQHPALVKDMEQWNAIAYASTLLPQYEFLGTGEPPETLADWSGMRVRAGGGVGQAMEVLGATRQTVPAAETYTLMQRGGVDAVSFPFSYAHAAYKINELATWYTSNLQPGSSECPMVFNKKAYEALPTQYQDLLMSLKDEVTQAMIDKYMEADEKNIPAFEEAMEKIVYDDATLAEFKKVAGEPVYAKFVEDYKDQTDAQAVLDRMFELVEEAEGMYLEPKLSREEIIAEIRAMQQRLGVLLDMLE